MPTNAAEKIFSSPEEMDERLHQRLRPWEVFGLLFCLGIAGIIYHYYADGNTAIVDLNAYLRAGHGDYRYYYYGYWFLPVFTILDKIPILAAYLIWTLLNLSGVWFGAKVFGGRTVPVLLSYQMLYLIFYGQISGILIGALGLMAWAVAHKRWDLAGVGLLIAATKPQTGALIGLFYLLCAPVSWRERLRILPIPMAGGIASLFLYPHWVMDLIQTWQMQPANAFGSISLWQWVGPLCLILWVPVIFLKMKPEMRFIMLVATSMLALPYFQQADLLVLFVLPCAWLPLIGNIGYLMAWQGWNILPWLCIIPLLEYGYCLSSVLQNLSQKIPAAPNYLMMERIKKILS